MRQSMPTATVRMPDSSNRRDLSMVLLAEAVMTRKEMERKGEPLSAEAEQLWQELMEQAKAEGLEIVA